jgi:ABC-type uncharacterized transport system ATPase subunit
LLEHRINKTIPNEVICVSKGQTLQDWVNSIKDENCRKDLMQRGEIFAKLFLSYRRNYTSITNSDSTEIHLEMSAPEENDSINKIIVNHDIIDVNNHAVDELHFDDDDHDDVHEHEVRSNDNNKEFI